MNLIFLTCLKKNKLFLFIFSYLNCHCCFRWCSFSTFLEIRLTMNVVLLINRAAINNETNVRILLIIILFYALLITIIIYKLQDLTCFEVTKEYTVYVPITNSSSLWQFSTWSKLFIFDIFC